MADEEMIPHILNLALQSKWMQWDNVIELDLKWKEIMYGMSPSMLSFYLNAVQDTLPHPQNLRRWKIEKEPSCTLCKWMNVGLQYILCGCKEALTPRR